MRSFIGDYKVLAGVIPRCASVLAPLEDAIAGRQSSDPVKWTDELSKDFTTAQTVLSSNRTITLPKPNDQLWIVTDGAVGKPGIGATLYITREGKLILAGFFSAKLRDRQVSWLPCEVEALAIAVAIKHFSPYIIQSRHKVSILTDSKPCVQAFEKLCRGEFSVSPRVSTFLSTVSRYQATVQHVAGAAILPSDLASRDAPDCNDMSCQVCSFIKQTEDSVIGHLSVEYVLKGTSKLPFTSRAAWQSIQAECADLRRTHAHLTQGIRPSKKLTNIKDIKRYSSIATIASDGLLIVQGNEPLSPPRQRIVVPRQVLEGLLTALHIKLEHPSRHQLRSAANRYFFALDMDKAIDHVTKSCHPCAALKKTRGLSAREVWMQRDQFSNHQVPLSDQELVHKQHDLRNANHPYSEKSKAPLKKAIDAPQVKIGDLVYLYSDRNTSCSRDRYLVTSTEGVWCNIRKFTGPQHRKTPYRVKASECYKVPNHMSLNRLSYRTPQHDSSDARPSPPEPPEVPRGISTPPTPHSYIPTDNFHELVTTPPATVDNEDHLNTITDNQSPRSRTYLDNQAPRNKTIDTIEVTIEGTWRAIHQSVSKVASGAIWPRRLPTVDKRRLSTTCMEHFRRIPEAMSEFSDSWETNIHAALDHDLLDEKMAKKVGKALKKTTTLLLPFNLKEKRQPSKKDVKKLLNHMVDDKFGAEAVDQLFLLGHQLYTLGSHYLATRYLLRPMPTKWTCCPETIMTSKKIPR
ncbi:hypothetical protein QZH41_000446 [Actinostola sp. cb2023]|nr:hypothetical protein QZH41_000446 [Actinostola sp. cb2023]